MDGFRSFFFDHMQRKLEWQLLIGPHAVEQRNRDHIGGFKIHEAERKPERIEESFDSIFINIVLLVYQSVQLQFLPPTQLIGRHIFHSHGPLPI